MFKIDNTQSKSRKFAFFKSYAISIPPPRGSVLVYLPSPSFRHRSGRDARNPITSCPWFLHSIVLVFFGRPEAAMPVVDARVGLKLGRCRSPCRTRQPHLILLASKNMTSRRQTVYRNAAPIAISLIIACFSLSFAAISNDIMPLIGEVANNAGRSACISSSMVVATIPTLPKNSAIGFC
jgi:hypothetical protein